MVVMEFPGMWCVRFFVCYHCVLTGVPHVSYSGTRAFLEGSVLLRSVPSACLVSGSFTFSQMTPCSGIISLASSLTSQSELGAPQWTRMTPLLLCLVIVSSSILTLNSVSTGTTFFNLCVWYKVVT